ncbi:basic salivary proline-rich protein 1-like [Notolabrus celidotus]|uniref:basic salivary proline-rich protein 1-like n=1 Tax=Notolabrus celidotus TaxID=1203425 RepID=UPI00148F88E9|nr:basic salivary proline-rich protein 1-like [Notolabrus celidotus]
MDKVHSRPAGHSTRPEINPSIPYGGREPTARVMPQSNPRRRPHGHGHGHGHGQSRRSRLVGGQNQPGRPEGKGRPMNGPFPCPHHPTTTTPASQPQPRTPPAQPARPPPIQNRQDPGGPPGPAPGSHRDRVQKRPEGEPRTRPHNPTTPPPPLPVEPEAAQAPSRHCQPPVKRPRAQPQAPATVTAKGPTKPNTPTTPGAGPTTSARPNPKGHPRVTAMPL